MSKSVFAQIADVDAAVAQATALLHDAETCVDANLYEAGFDRTSSAVQYHAGNIQVLLGVIAEKLSNATEKLAELDHMLHETK